MTHTFKSRRRKNQQMPPMWRPAFDAWQAKDEARRRALPPRLPNPQAGKVLQEWTMKAADGWCHVIELLQPPDRGTRRPRSDQFVLVVDGAVALPLAGMVEIMEHLRTKVLPKQMTRMQRHQADQIAETPCHLL